MFYYLLQITEYCSGLIVGWWEVSQYTSVKQSNSSWCSEPTWSQSTNWEGDRHSKRGKTLHVIVASYM